MDWENLRFFLHVARTGKITDAARNLGVDHSTVSRRLADFEIGIGIRLFDRAGRRLRITPAGERLYKTAEQVETLLLREAPQRCDGNGQVAGTVRIGAPEGLGVGYLGSRLHRLTEGHPGIELELVALPQNYSLAAREVDIAITLDKPRSGNIATRKLTDYVLLLYGSAEYLRQASVPEKLDDLSRHVICGYIRPLLHTHKLDYHELQESVLSQFTRYRSTSIIAQMEVITSGAAIGVLPCFLVSEVSGLRSVMRNEIALRRSYWLSFHDDLRRVERIRTIAARLVELARQDRRLFVPD